MFPAEPKVDTSQGTGHGSNPTPQVAPQPTPANDGSAEAEHFKTERVPTTKQDVDGT